jgi:hypothetical protein
VVDGVPKSRDFVLILINGRHAVFCAVSNSALAAVSGLVLLLLVPLFNFCDAFQIRHRRTILHGGLFALKGSRLVARYLEYALIAKGTGIKRIYAAQIDP